MSAAQLVIALAWPVVALALGLAAFVFVLRVLDVQKWRALALKTVETNEAQLKALAATDDVLHLKITHVETELRNELARIENLVVL